MKFELDKQTQTDLEIFRDEKDHESIFKYFNRTKTLGGKEYLYKIMHNPFTDIGILKNRSKIISELSKSEFSMNDPAASGRGI